MKKIAIVTSSEWYNRCIKDQMLKKALIQAGMSPEIVCWNSKINWQAFDLILISSTWDYYENYTAFCDWLMELKMQKINVANGADNILANINKVKQLALLKESPFATITTKRCTDTEQLFCGIEELDVDKIVLKPSVSCSGYNTKLIDLNTVNVVELINDTFRALKKDFNEVLLQPYIKQIKDGELSFVYFNGKFSHAVRRFPGVLSEKKKAEYLKVIPEEYLHKANQIANYFQAQELLYMRIDMVKTDAEFLIMEIEITEPDLYLTLAKQNNVEAIDNFVNVIKTKLKTILL